MRLSRRNKVNREIRQTREHFLTRISQIAANCRKPNGRPSFGCAEGATEISPVLVHQHLRREIVPQNNSPLLAERGKGRGEESNQ